MILRRYRPEDVAELAELFYETVHAINTKDYREEQVNAWATGDVDLSAWDTSLREHLTYIAVDKGKIVGFGDMDESGYLDRLFVHKDYQGMGIATAICDRLEKEVGTSRYEVHASITAKPFFEGRGYRVAIQREVKRRGVLLTNFLMEKVRQK